MLHIDIPTIAQIERLAARRVDTCVSIYLATSSTPSGTDASRIELKNLVASAVAQLREARASDGDILAIQNAVDDLIDDAGFWATLSNSLAIFVTPAEIRTFRLPNRLESVAEVSDRYFIKPLMRAVTFPQTAFVLALAQNSVRLLSITPDAEPRPINVPALPDDVADASGAITSGRSMSSRMEGAEGHKVRLGQYARAIDRALRPVLAGAEYPLIIAAAPPLDAIFRAVNSYPHLAATEITGNPEGQSDAQLAAAARPVLDEIYAGEMAERKERMADRMAHGGAVTDLSDIARAVTYGAVDTLFVDIDDIVPGTVDEETGAIALADGPNADRYGVVDEIVRRAILTHARIFAVRSEDIPGGGSAAAGVRWSV